MFTGIVEEVGKVIFSAQGKLTVSGKIVLEGMEPGASIAVNGVCLTVTEISGDSFSVAVMPETIHNTDLGGLSRGDKVNLERPLSLNKQIGGHLVQGHIDGTGKIKSVVREGGATLIRIEAPSDIARYVVKKGFIAVDGISLTVTECETNTFMVSIVEFTRQGTILSEARIGDIVNLEIDIIAKYVEKFVNPDAGEISIESLRKHGFTA